MQAHAQIFTTLGWIPADQVDLRESVLEENDDTRVVRTDKFVNGLWVGNDLNIIIKRPVPLEAETSNIG